MAGKKAANLWLFVGLAVAVVGLLIGTAFVPVFPTCSVSALGYCVVPNPLFLLEQGILGGSLVLVGLVVAIAYGGHR